MDNLNWKKCNNNVWCSLMTLDLNTITDDLGVYIIWHGGNSPFVVYVGQGNIRERLSAHRSDYDIAKYGLFGTLFVTWASVPRPRLDGVERFLADTYGPAVGYNHPRVLPISVNLPQ